MTTISKNFTFTSGAVILASEHNSNFDTIYDDYNGSIGNENIRNDAAIANAKLNLAAISQNMTFSGNLTLTGSANDWSGATCSDGGIFTTIDINGGTIDGTNIGVTTPGTAAVSTLKVGTTNQGDILYDNGTSLVRLTPGTSGEFLKTLGAAANPAWAAVTDPAITIAQSSDTFSSASTVAITQAIASGEVFKIIYEGTVSDGTFPPWLRINTDSTGVNYDSLVDGREVDGSTFAEVAEENSAANQIPLIGTAVGNTGAFAYSTTGSFQIEMTISARNSDTQISWTCNSFTSDLAAESLMIRGIGIYNAGVPATIELVRGSGTATISGRWYVQQLSAT
jgi:hypothetical protein